MSVRITKRPYNVPHLDGFGDSDIFSRKSIKVNRCPVCGGSTLPGNTSLYRTMGYTGVKDGHAYSCRNLSVTFCDDCVSGEGGVDIICKVLEASPTVRSMVERDCEAILDARRKKHRETATKWGIGLGVVASVIGICCLIWKPEEVFSVIGIIAIFIIVGLLQGAVRR